MPTPNPEGNTPDSREETPRYVVDVDFSNGSKGPSHVVRIEHGAYASYHYTHESAGVMCDMLTERLALTRENDSLRKALEAASVIVMEYAKEQRGFADQIISPKSMKAARLSEAERAESVLLIMHSALTRPEQPSGQQPSKQEGEK